MDRLKRGVQVIFLSLVVLSPPLAPSLSGQANDECLVCHGEKELEAESGKRVYVDGQALDRSVHGQAGLSCIDCHADLARIQEFPHPSPLKAVECRSCHDEAGREFQASIHALAGRELGEENAVGCSDCHGTHDIRATDDFDSPVFPLNLPATCERCHLTKAITTKGPAFVRQYRESVHFKALEKSGLTMSANCGHCHGAHETRRVTDPLSLVSRKNIIQTCGRCHVGIRRDYLEGVHGKDYVKGIKDVPVCTDCHSEHDIQSPQDLRSRVYATRIAELCVSCHDNVALSRQYGFLTSRMKTYSETFHGTASKFGETRVANCASCHGYHDIRPSSDPNSPIHPANLPRTCGQCHPGASRRFAEGPIHVLPTEATPARYRASHTVKKIYILVITVIISVMVIFVVADLLRRLIKTSTHG